MINLYNGRLIIQRRKLCENWRAKYNLPNQKEHIIDLLTKDIREAFIQAQYHYIALRSNQSFVDVEESFNGKRKCWSCVNWLPRLNECSFGFAEAKQDRGRYARYCELYDDVGLEPNRPSWYLPID
jgi:hypothetical protein